MNITFTGATGFIGAQPGAQAVLGLIVLGKVEWAHTRV